MKKQKKERVVVDTPIKVGDATKNEELRFKVLVMAPISGKRKPAIKTPRAVTTTGHSSLDRLMSETQPTVAVEVGNKLAGATTQDGVAPTIPLTLTFRRMEDFTAVGLEGALAENMTAFREKLAILQKLTNFQAKLMNSKDLEGIDEDLDNLELRDALANLGDDKRGGL